jgi:hypothetical protein
MARTKESAAVSNPNDLADSIRLEALQKAKKFGNRHPVLSTVAVPFIGGIILPLSALPPSSSMLPMTEAQLRFNGTLGTLEGLVSGLADWVKNGIDYYQIALDFRRGGLIDGKGKWYPGVRRPYNRALRKLTQKEKERLFRES